MAGQDSEFFEVQDGTRSWVQRRKHGRHPEKLLSVQRIRGLEAGRHHDGNGLYLVVEPSGTRHWIQRVTIRGRVRQVGHGSFPLVSLAEARALAFQFKKVARAGGDPLTDRRRAVPTFAEAAQAVIEIQSPAWKNAKHVAQWMATLEVYAFPKLGRRPVDAITSGDILSVLMAIWHEKPETARRVRQRINTIMRWCVAEGHCEHNVAGDDLKGALPRQRPKAEHFKALPYSKVADAIKRVRESNAAPHTKLAFEFIALTATRAGEVRGARWSEFDLDNAVWTIPASRMKASVEHRVPLSERAVEVLQEAAKLRCSDLVFPSPTRRELSDNALSKLLRELGIAGTVHGLRSSFRDWASEKTHASREILEACLAHTVKDKAEAAYARSDLLEKRRPVMETWADFLANKKGTVIRIA